MRRVVPLQAAEAADGPLVSDRQEPVPAPGDWIRFMMGGRFTIGLVEYIDDSCGWPFEWITYTNEGATSLYFELRRPVSESAPCGKEEQK